MGLKYKQASDQSLFEGAWDLGLRIWLRIRISGFRFQGSGSECSIYDVEKWAGGLGESGISCCIEAARVERIAASREMEGALFEGLGALVWDGKRIV